MASLVIACIIALNVHLSSSVCVDIFLPDKTKGRKDKVCPPLDEEKCGKKKDDCEWIEDWFNEVEWTAKAFAKTEDWKKLFGDKAPNPFDKKNYIVCEPEDQNKPNEPSKKMKRFRKNGMKAPDFKNAAAPNKDDGVSLVRLDYDEKSGKVEKGSKLKAKEESIDIYTGKIVTPLYHAENGKESHVISTIFDRGDKKTSKAGTGFYKKSEYETAAKTVREEIGKYDVKYAEKIKGKLGIKGKLVSIHSIAPLPGAAAKKAGVANKGPNAGGVKPNDAVNVRRLAAWNEENDDEFSTGGGSRRKLLVRGDDRREIAGLAPGGGNVHAGPPLMDNIGMLALWVPTAPNNAAGYYWPFCTAQAIANDHLITCGHCICSFEPTTNVAEWSPLANIRWFPGWNNHNTRPTHADLAYDGNTIIETVYLTDQWLARSNCGQTSAFEDWAVLKLRRSHGAPPFDVAAIKLKRPADAASPYEFPPPGPNNIVNIYTAGYPGEIEDAQVSDINTIANQYVHATVQIGGQNQRIAAGGPGVEFLRRDAAHHWIENEDTCSGGQSGSAYYNMGNGGEIVGILAAGYDQLPNWPNGEVHEVANLGPEISPKRFNTICYILSKTYWIWSNPICAVYYRNGLNPFPPFVPLAYQSRWYLNEGFYGDYVPAHLQLNDFAYYDDDKFMGYYDEDGEEDAYDDERKQFEFAAYDEDTSEYSNNNHHRHQQAHVAQHVDKHRGYGDNNNHYYAENGYESSSGGGVQWALMIVVAALLFIVCCIGLCICAVVGAGLGYFSYQQFEDQKGYIGVERMEV